MSDPTPTPPPEAAALPTHADHPAIHFGAVADGYARHRPTYPAALFDWLADATPARGLAWDCATGNGQAAVALAERFARVEATDMSASQVAAAVPHPRVAYRVAPAESSGLADASCDLVTVAQALHWFDVPAFGREAMRVLAPRGVLAAWCYGRCAITPVVDAAVHMLYEDVLGAWWHPGRAHVENGYRDLALPGTPLAAPALAIERAWTLDDLTGYLATWSAVHRLRQATGEDAVATMRPRLAAAWGEPDVPRPVRWPLSVRATRRDA